MHPIHYSFWLNLVILAMTGALSFFLKSPLIFVIGLLVLQHSLARFQNPADQERHPAQSFGFVPADPDDDEGD